MKCRNCGKEISDNSNFCRFCGTMIEKAYCRRCGAVLEQDSAFCSECGAPTAKTGSDENVIPAGGFRWEEDSSGMIFITGHCGTGGEVNIPPVINGKRVTEICSGAFRSSTAVTSIIIRSKPKPNPA